jgi:hypothetical protein
MMTHPKSLILRTRVTSAEARGQAKQKESDGVILVTEGLPPEPDFDDQDDLWRGQKIGKAVAE